MSLIINPQLCRTYNNEPIEKEHYLEPKFDGLRGLVAVDDMKQAVAYSRNGKPFWNIDHILTELQKLEWKNYILDGEFYSVDWNQSMSILKRQSDHPDKLNIRYHVWDVLAIPEWQNGRSLRPLRTRRTILEKGFPGLEFIKVVDPILVNNQQEIQEGYVKLLEMGYEGGILKDPDSQYVLGARSKGWLKLKPWTDADLQVVGAVEGMGKHVGRLGALQLSGTAEWKNKSYTVLTEVGTGFNDVERESLWALHKADKLLGTIIEIKFQDITAEGACRFPVFNRIRSDK
jgi:ATP-dependent DNA ligase